MLTLLLLRHAKSSWGDPSGDDAGRPLTKRGRKAAGVMGGFIAASKLVPELVLCSPAKRARETWDLAAAELPSGIELQIVESLYDFGDGSALLAAIRAHGGNTTRLMLVGHNPSIEQLAQRLIGSGEPELRRRIAEKYPTGALTVIAVGIEKWPDLQEATGRLVHFIRPRDIAAGSSGD
jgi:phosphohistidine phosphatase